MGVFALEQTVEGQTVQQTLIEKLPPAVPINNNYIKSSVEDTIPFHSSTSDKLEAQKNGKAAMTIVTFARKYISTEKKARM